MHPTGHDLLEAFTDLLMDTFPLSTQLGALEETLLKLRQRAPHLALRAGKELLSDKAFVSPIHRSADI